MTANKSKSSVEHLVNAQKPVTAPLNSDEILTLLQSYGKPEKLTEKELKRYTELMDNIKRGKYNLKRWLGAIDIMKLVLRKFYYSDEQAIGYNELNDKLKDWLCEEIGDAEFVKFCDNVKPS